MVASLTIIAGLKKGLQKENLLIFSANAPLNKISSLNTRETPIQYLQCALAYNHYQQGILLDEAVFQGIANNIPIPELNFTSVVTYLIEDTTQIEELNRKRFTSSYYMTVTHELKTPLNSLSGSLNLLKPFLTELSGSYFNICTLSLKNLKTLINSSITLAKVESDQLIVKKVPTLLSKVIQKVVDSAKYEIIVKNLKTEIFCDNNIHCLLICKKLLKQVMQILVNNSIKYTSNDGTISISADIDEYDDKWINIVVSDTGIGIDATEINELFIPYGNLTNKLKKNATGACLKLTLAKSLTKLMEGSISVFSVLEKGTKFTLRLPYTKAHMDSDDCMVNSKLQQLSLYGANVSQRDDSLQVSQTETLMPLGDKVILIVDDQLFNIVILRKYLENLGYKHDSASNGKEAVDKVRRRGSNNYSVVLMDMNMPIMDGMEACKLISDMALMQEVPKIPLVMITAQESEEFRMKALSVGVQHYAVKPISFEALKNILSKIL
jgi:signal transduction histidine kinase/CheY-like chemotaxis protein